MLEASGEMLSRAGKFTEEIHMILKSKEEILAGGSAATPKKVIVKSNSVSKFQSLQEKVPQLHPDSCRRKKRNFSSRSTSSNKKLKTQQLQAKRTKTKNFRR